MTTQQILLLIGIGSLFIYDILNIIFIKHRTLLLIERINTLKNNSPSKERILFSIFSTIILIYVFFTPYWYVALITISLGIVFLTFLSSYLKVFKEDLTEDQRKVHIRSTIFLLILNNLIEMALFSYIIYDILL
jgi:hypothetical protein